MNNLIAIFTSFLLFFASGSLVTAVAILVTNQRQRAADDAHRLTPQKYEAFFAFLDAVRDEYWRQDVAATRGQTPGLDAAVLKAYDRIGILPVSGDVLAAAERMLDLLRPPARTPRRHWTSFTEMERARGVFRVAAQRDLIRGTERTPWLPARPATVAAS